MTEQSNLYYIYRHIRLDKNVPFYIGKGKKKNHGPNKRNYDRSKRRDNRNDHWKRVVAKTDYSIDIMIDNLTLEEVCEKERFFIELYGRSDLGLGTLCNQTDGGESDHNFSAETKKKMTAHMLTTYEQNIDRHVYEEPNTGCWLWAGEAKKTRSTPSLKMSFGGKRYSARRIICEKEKVLPLGRTDIIKSKCGCEYCVNPDHMTIVKDTKGISILNNRGELNPQSVLKTQDVLSIRELGKQGMSQTKIGRLFNVSQTMVGLILRGERWGWVK